MFSHPCEVLLCLQSTGTRERKVVLYASRLLQARYHEAQVASPEPCVGAGHGAGCWYAASALAQRAPTLSVHAESAQAPTPSAKLQID